MTNTRPHVALNGQYSMAEAASLLDIDVRTLYRWRKNGYIKTKFHRFSKRPFVEGREISKVFDVFY